MPANASGLIPVPKKLPHRHRKPAAVLNQISFPIPLRGTHTKYLFMVLGYNKGEGFCAFQELSVMRAEASSITLSEFPPPGSCVYNNAGRTDIHDLPALLADGFTEEYVVT